MSIFRQPVAVLVFALTVALTTLVGMSPAAAAGTVTVQVQGQGRVTGEGIDCTQTGSPGCTEFYPNEPEECAGDPPHEICFEPPPTRDLTAGPDSNGFVYDGFDGCDETSGRICTVTVTSSRTVTARFRDAAPPTVGLVAPSAPVRGSFVLSASSSDNAGVTRVEFSVGGALVGIDAFAPYSLTIDSSTYADGSRQVKASAFDAAGNSSSSTSTVLMDNTAPVLGVTGPDGATFAPGSTQTWTLDATDATSGLASRSCAVAAVGTTPTPGTCSGDTSHQVTGLAGGSYVFTARAVDVAGNETTATRSFTIDASAPETSFTKTPRSVVRTTKRKAKVRFGFATSEPGSTFRCRLDRGAWKPCPSSAKFKVKRGKHKLLVVSTDTFGNVDATPAKYKWKVKKKR